MDSGGRQRAHGPEWALYTVLQNLGVRADALLGCSTGEFATLPMSGAVDILDVAPLFYRLSTNVAKCYFQRKISEPQIPRSLCSLRTTTASANQSKESTIST